MYITYIINSVWEIDRIQCYAIAVKLKIHVLQNMISIDENL